MAVLLLSVLAGLFSACNDTAADEATIARHKKLAGELRDTKLYRAAIEEYEKLLDMPGVDNTTRANVNYLIAKIYFENIADYEQAAAYYVRARALDPEGSFINEASKNLVASLERMGHMVDAKRQLDAATDLDAEPRREGDVAVARIGGVPIWLSTIEEQIQMLPADLQKQLTSREAKIKYVHQYVGIELLYHAAVREGYDEDPEILKQERLLHRRLMVDSYVLDKVMPNIQIDTLDVRNYYLAHRDQRYDNAPYDSVKAQVFLDYQGEKTEAAFSDYVSELAGVEKVEFLDHNVN